MKTLAEILVESDPVAHEPRPSSRERLLARQRILDAAVFGELPRRRVAILAIAALALVGAAAGSRIWSRLAADVVAAVRFEVRLAEESPADGLRSAAVAGAQRTIYLHPETVVTNSDIAEAHVITGRTESTFGVAVTFTPEGAAKISRATRDHLGRPVAILLDGQVVMAPVVKAPISTAAVISGDHTQAEAERIVNGIVGR